MIRNLKALGLALVAVFAISAMAASAASAEGTTTTPAHFTSDGPVHIQGKQVSKEGNVLTALGIPVECEVAEFTNTDPETLTSPYFAPETSEEITISPTYEECESEGHPATVFMNKCDYVFTVDHHETAEPFQTAYELTAHIVCPEGETITVVIYNDAEHTEERCNVHIGSQEGIGGLTAENEEGGTVRVKGTATGISGTFTPRTCTFGLHLTLNSELDTDVRLEGESKASEATEISVTKT